MIYNKKDHDTVIVLLAFDKEDDFVVMYIITSYKWQSKSSLLSIATKAKF